MFFAFSFNFIYMYILEVMLNFLKAKELLREEEKHTIKEGTLLQQVLHLFYMNIRKT